MRRIPQKQKKSFPKRRPKRRGVTSFDSTPLTTRINAPQIVVINEQLRTDRSPVRTELESRGHWKRPRDWGAIVVWYLTWR